MTEEKEECIFCTVKICGTNKEKFLELKSHQVRKGGPHSNEWVVNKLISMLPNEFLNQYIGGKK